MRPSSSSSDEKEQLSWLPSLTLPAEAARSASALPAARSVHVVNVGSPPSLALPGDTAADGDGPAHVATAWRCMSDRRPLTAASASMPCKDAFTSALSGRAPFNTSATRFVSQSTNAASTRPSSPSVIAAQPATAAHFSSASRSVSRSASSFSLLDSDSCPSYSPKGYTAGFASSSRRFPRSRRSRPSPGSYDPARQLDCAQQHSRPISQPRAASAARTAPSPPSVPFVSSYFLRRPTPAPTAYWQQPASRSVRAASMGTAERPAPFGEPARLNGELLPSAASYDPLWQATRPSSSNAASVHFSSLTQRMQPQQPVTVAQVLRPQAVDDGRAAQHRPHSAHSLHRPRSAHTAAAVAGTSGRLSYGVGSARTPSPAAYTVRLDSSRPHAPHHSFAPPVTQPPADGVAALVVTRGGAGLSHNLTQKGRAAERERWTVQCRPASTASEAEQRPSHTGSISSLANSGRKLSDWSSSAGLSQSDSTAVIGHQSFHFNHRHVWV